MNAWVSVFLQSPVNGASYGSYQLAQQNWQWPEDTWFQKRLGFGREQRFGGPKSHQKIRNLMKAKPIREITTSVAGNSSVSLTTNGISVQTLSFDPSLIGKNAARWDSAPNQDLGAAARHPRIEASGFRYNADQQSDLVS
jgi:hypothetical protein